MVDGIQNTKRIPFLTNMQNFLKHFSMILNRMSSYIQTKFFTTQFIFKEVTLHIKYDKSLKMEYRSTVGCSAQNNHLNN